MITAASISPARTWRSSSSLHGVFVTSIVACVLSPVFGMRADRVGAYRLFCFFIAGWLTCVFPLFWYLLAEPTASRPMIVQVIGMLLVTRTGRRVLQDDRLEVRARRTTRETEMQRTN